MNKDELINEIYSSLNHDMSHDSSKERRDMNIKEKAMKLLLTTTKTYNEIAQEIIKTTPGAKTTSKCIAYYAHQMRKVDKTCLDHRATKKTTMSTIELIKKYKK